MKNLIFCIALLLLASCINKPEPNGYSFENIKFEQLQAGVSDYQQVLNVMGSPSVQSNIEKEWMYYSDTTEKVLFFRPKIVERKIVLVKFDDSGIVKEIKNYSKGDSQKVKYVSDYTRIEDRKFNVLGQIIGNLGMMGGGAI